MNLTKAVLKVNNQKYDILRFSHAFQRDVDQKGRPCSHIYGGEIFAQVESTEDSELFRLMTSKDKPKVTGSIEVLSGDGEVCIKRIEFEDAYIYQFIEEMQRAGPSNMTTNVAISPMRLDINNKMLRLDRSDEYATGWQEYEEEEVKYIVRTEPQAMSTPLVTAVKGAKTAYLNTEVEYRVKNYNINVSQNDRNRVKWMVEIEGKREKLKKQGEVIKLTIKKEWLDKEIIIMPYLQSPTVKVSEKTMVRCKHVDGAIAIAEYIVNEIKTNTRSQIADSIRYWTLDEEYKKRYEEWKNNKSIGKYLNPPEPQNLLKAKILWIERVFAKRPWDHKPKIRDKFRHLAVERTHPQTQVIYKSYYHKYKDYDYYYDVWSNIHYGYVGLSVGFDEDTLLNGADLAQIIDSKGGNAEDTGDDKTAIKIGFNLYYKYGRFAETLTAQDILNALDAAIMTESKLKHVCFAK